LSWRVAGGGAGLAAVAGVLVALELLLD